MKRTETFQNLLVLSIADGIIEDNEKSFIDGISYQLGITDEEYDYFMKNIASLDYVIPNNREEAYNELYKMILLSLTDGEMSDEEETELYYFAAKAGFSKDEFISIVNYVYQQYETHQEATIAYNKEQYQHVLDLLRSAGKDDKAIVTAFTEVVRSKNLNFVFSEGEAINHAFYAWLWLVYCRYIKINKGGLVLTVMTLDLIKAGQYSLDDFFIDLKLNEELANDNMQINILGISIEEVKTELRQSFPFNA